MMIYRFDGVENIAGKGENIGKQNFLLFPQCFADDNSHVAKMIIYLYNRLENIAEKEKMLVTSIFSFSHNVLQTIYMLLKG